MTAKKAKKVVETEPAKKAVIMTGVKILLTDSTVRNHLLDDSLGDKVEIYGVEGNDLILEVVQCTQKEVFPYRGHTFNVIGTKKFIYPLRTVARVEQAAVEVPVDKAHAI